MTTHRRLRPSQPPLGIGLALLLALALAPELRALDIRNPSFEEGRVRQEEIASSWWWNNTACNAIALDTETKRSGQRSLRLDITEDAVLSRPQGRYWHKHLLVTQPVTAEPDTIYTVKAWIKTTLRQGAAGLAIQMRKKNGALIANHWPPQKFLVVTGPADDWQELVYTFKTPEECERFDLILGAENALGQVWFDDVSASEGASVPAVPMTAKRPEIDGRASFPGEWDNALVLNGFIQVGDEALKRTPALTDTEVRLLVHGDTLLLRAFCQDPAPADIVAHDLPRDGKVWDDDCFEIFIDAQRSASAYYQLIINAAGALYDANGRDLAWNPDGLQLATWKDKAGWGLEMAIPFIELGYGSVEAANPNKPMAFAFFRKRLLRGMDKGERSAWLIWPIGNYSTPKNYCPVDVGLDVPGATVSFRTRGADAVSTSIPQAWVTKKPLYEELMGSQPLLPPGRSAGTMSLYGLMSGHRRKPSTAFALQHGLKYHYAELAQMFRELNISPAIWVEKEHDAFTTRMQQQHNLKTSINPQPQYGGYQFRGPLIGVPNTHGSKHYLIADPRVQDAIVKHVEQQTRQYGDRLDSIVLGHETHYIFFETYDALRLAYLEQEPDLWRQFEDEARKRYGFDQHTLPETAANATPFERIVLHRWILDAYNDCMRRCAEVIRGLYPDMVIASDIEVNGIFPMTYENTPGVYDYVTQQLLYGGGYFRQDVAFGTKLMGDVSGIPVMPGPHIEHYFLSLNEHEVNEVLSSAFRVGAAALKLWLCDWFGKTMTDIYGAPRRFHEIKNCIRHVSTMRRLRFPEPDTAVLFSNFTRFGRFTWREGGSGTEYESLFTVLGPRARSWFRFLSDQTLPDARTLNAYKVIYVPDARYQDQAVVDTLLAYVRQGGTLVLESPDAFRFNLDGAERRDFCQELTGLRLEATRPNPGAFAIVADPGFPGLSGLNTATPSFLKDIPTAAITGPRAKALAVYPDGGPAIVLNRLGEGRVLTFTVNPFTQDLYGNATWWSFFRTLQQDLGCAVDHDLWRFRFPMAPEPAPAPWPADLVCLTGNAYAWEYDAIQEGPNLRLPFKTEYSTAPDLIPDAGDNLFNRGTSLQQKPVAASQKQPYAGLEPYAVAWRNQEPISVTLTFANEVTVSHLKLWAHGGIPDLELAALDQNGAWTTLDRHETANTPIGELDVREIILKCPAPVKTTACALRFAARNQDLYLAEIELWGEN